MTSPQTALSHRNGRTSSAAAVVTGTLAAADEAQPGNRLRTTVTVPGSFTANATKKKTIAGSIKADATKLRNSGPRRSRRMRPSPNSLLRSRRLHCDGAIL